MNSTSLRGELETALQPTSRSTVPVDDRDWLPALEGRHVTLRALRPSDAGALHGLLTAPEVARFVSAPPSSVEAFERFIVKANRQRSGKYICFAVTLKGSDTAIGMFQIRETEPNFQAAEWGFALGSAFWGTGIFSESAQLILQFVFLTLGVHRLEARAAVRNGRGGRALQKLGAVQEGVLRKSFKCNGEYLDQVLYAIVRTTGAPRARLVSRHWSSISSSSAQAGGGRMFRCPAYFDRFIGRDGSDDHSLHDPGYNFAPCRPACSSASRFWHAVTPDPQ